MKRLKFSLLLALAVTLWAHASEAATITFNQTTGDWFTGANWSSGNPPTATDTASVQNGRLVNITSAGAVADWLLLGAAGNGSGGSATISGAGTLTLGATGLSVSNNGTLQVDSGGTLNVNGFFTFGAAGGTGGASTTSNLIVKDAGSVVTVNQTGVAYQFGTGSANQTNVSVLNGGKLTFGTGPLTFGAGTGNNTQVTVSGTGSSLDSSGGLFLADFGTGGLTISSGGVVTSTTAQIGYNNAGTALLTDLGSRLTISSTLSVGSQTSTSVGTFTVQNGATGSSATLLLGNSVGGHGDMTITGTGTSWTNTGSLQIRTSTQGSSVTVSAGGLLTTGTTSGSLSVGTKGVLTVTGANSRVTTPGSLFVGTGAKFLLQNGATASTGFSTLTPGAAGQLEVSGGAQWTTSSIDLSAPAVGDPSTFTINSGGTVSTGYMRVSTGVSTDLSSVIVSGTGSALSATSTSTDSTIGSSSPGAVTIQNGATLTTSGTLNVGGGKSGTLTISGTGSQWSANTIRVATDQGGTATTGTLALSGGATVTSTTASVGFATFGGQGVATVDGAGTQWNTGAITIGDRGAGRLTISNGAVMTSTSAIAGANSNGTSANVTVTGPSSRWTVTANLSIKSTATLTVDNGATLNVGGGTGALAIDTTVLGATALLKVGTGGLVGNLQAGSINVGPSGSLAFDFTDSLTLAASIAGSTVTKAGTGTLNLTGSGHTFISLSATGGTLRVTHPSGLGVTGVSLANTHLILANDVGSFFGNSGTFTTTLNLATDTTITSDRVTTGSGVTHSVVGVNMGAGGSKLTVDAGSNVSGGIAGFSSSFTFTGDATLDVRNGAALTLSQYNDSGASRTWTKTGPGSLLLGYNASVAGHTSTFVVNEGTLVEQTEIASNPYNLILNATTPGGTVLYQLDFINHPVNAIVFGGPGATSTSTTKIDTADSTLLISSAVTYDATNNPRESLITGNVAFVGWPVTVGDSTNADSDLTIAANILAGGFTKLGPGVLTLSGDNLFAGTFTLNEGPIVATGKANAIGSNLTLNGGSLRLAYDLPVTGAGDVTLNTGGTITLDRATPGSGITAKYSDLFFNSAGLVLTLTRGTNVVSGTPGLAFDRLYVATSDIVETGAGTLLSVEQLTSNAFSGQLTKRGPGTLRVNGVHSGFYLGPTDIQEGKFILGGSLDGAVSIAAGAVMTTPHTSAAINGALTVHSDAQSGGVLAPGDTGGAGVGSIGKLSVDGAISLGDAGSQQAARLQLELGGLTPGLSYDQISLTGALSLTNVRLELTLANGFIPQVGQTFFLITGSSTSVMGSFANLLPADSASGGLPTIFVGLQEFAVSTTANASLGTLTGGRDVAALAIVPEAGTASLILVGALGLMSSRPRRQKSGVQR